MNFANTFKTAGKAIGTFVKNNKTTIMVVAGIIGFGAACVKTAQVAPEANKEIAEAETVQEKVVVAAKHYWPAAAMFAVSAASVLVAHKTNLGQIATFSGLYKMSEEKLEEYKNAAKVVVGEEKEKEIEHEVIEKRVANTPDDRIAKAERIGFGESLFYDTESDRWFWSDLDYVRRKIGKYEGDVEHEYIFAPLNDLYDMLGLEHLTAFDYVGYDHDKLPDISMAYAATKTGEVYTRLEYTNSPVTGDCHYGR